MWGHSTLVMTGGTLQTGRLAFPQFGADERLTPGGEVVISGGVPPSPMYIGSGTTNLRGSSFSLDGVDLNPTHLPPGRLGGTIMTPGGTAVPPSIAFDQIDRRVRVLIEYLRRADGSLDSHPRESPMLAPGSWINPVASRLITPADPGWERVRLEEWLNPRRESPPVLPGRGGNPVKKPPQIGRREPSNPHPRAFIEILRRLIGNPREAIRDSADRLTRAPPR